MRERMLIVSVHSTLAETVQAGRFDRIVERGRRS